MDRQVTPHKWVSSPTWGPPPPCKQAINKLVMVWVEMLYMDIILLFSFRLFVCLFVLFCYRFFFFTPLRKFQILFSRKLPFYPIIACRTVASFSLFFCVVFVLFQACLRADVSYFLCCCNKGNRRRLHAGKFQASEGKRETSQRTRDTRGEGRNEYDNSIKPSLKTSFQFFPARFIVFVTAPLLLFYVTGKIGEKKQQQNPTGVTFNLN